jgi:putative hydrolase of the HAD superfamily
VSGIRCILFDLGGVLAELHEEKALMAMCPHLSDRNAVHDAWVASPAVRAYETGRIGFEAFCEAAIRDLSVEVSLEAFKQAHAHFLGDPFPGAEELIRELQPHYTTACLSNTNEAHMAAFRSRTRVLELLDHRFLSFETGLVKPDAEAFLHVAESLAIKPEEVLFIDDKWQNVEAARKVGMDGFAATSLSGVRENLIKKGILP